MLLQLVHEGRRLAQHCTRGGYLESVFTMAGEREAVSSVQEFSLTEDTPEKRGRDWNEGARADFGRVSDRLQGRRAPQVRR